MAIRAGAMEGLALKPGFWNKRRVLVTGHTGFKGAWLSLWLESLGAEVTGYALPAPTVPSLFEAAGVAEGNVVSIEGDIRDLSRLTEACLRARPEVVIHMAAQSLVRASYAEPVDTLTTNIIGTVNLLESLRRAPGAQAVLVVTSDKCYENRERDAGYREGEALGGLDPYSSSKACAEIVAGAYRHSYFGTRGPALATARAGNVIGGGDWARDRLVTDAVTAFANGRSLSVRNPHALRPWQHVLDALRGYLTLAEQLAECGSEYAEAWNFGPADDQAKPVSWLADRLVSLWGADARWKQDTGEHPHEARFLRLDSAKANERLKWQPSLPLPSALEWVVEWYKAWNADPASARRITVDQIARYQALEAA